MKTIVSSGTLDLYCPRQGPRGSAPRRPRGRKPSRKCV